MRLNKPIVAASTVALLALAACGGSSGSGTSGPPGGTGGPSAAVPTGGNAGEGKDPTRAAPAADIPGAQTGGIVNVDSVAGLNTMDPSEAYYTNTSSILSGLVTRSLTQYVYDKGQMILVPDLATTLGTANKDFTKWTFTIRKGVKYENGQTVTPEDIKYGIERSFDRSSFPEGANYSNTYFKDGATYEGPYKSGDNYSGVIIKGQNLTILMSKPFPDMPYWGAFPAMGPIPKGAVSAPAKYALHPWSTGPYKFDQYTPEKSLTLVRNPNWDPNTDPGRHAYPDGYNMKFDVPTAKIDQIMLQDQGDAQNTLSYDNISSNDYISFKNDSPDRLVIGSTPCTAYWAPDYRKITDLKVRQALAWAYPYANVYAASAYIPGVTRSYGTNLMPPGIPGRVEFNPLPGHAPGSTDPAKSKALLKAAGATGFEIKFLYAADDPTSVDAKNEIVKGLVAGGFKATPVASTLADISTTRSDPNAPINVRSAGWCSDWPAGSSWFPPLFGTTDLSKEGLGNNFSAFSEPAVDAEMAKIQTLPIAKQPAAWNALDQSLQKKYMPLFVTGYYGAAMMRGSKINGFQDDTVFGMPTWKDIWLTK